MVCQLVKSIFSSEVLRRKKIQTATGEEARLPSVTSMQTTTFKEAYFCELAQVE